LLAERRMLTARASGENMADDHAEREAFLRDLARQVRLRLCTGKSVGEVCDWLRGLGLSGEAAAHLLATCPRGEARRRRRAAEPDATFAVPGGDSFAQLLVRENARPDWGRSASLALAGLVSLPLGLGLLRLLLNR
jgi:hypothetical protein